VPQGAAHFKSKSRAAVICLAKKKGGVATALSQDRLARSIRR
jgi:hypothetical protein